MESTKPLSKPNNTINFVNRESSDSPQTISNILKSINISITLNKHVFCSILVAMPVAVVVAVPVAVAVVALAVVVLAVALSVVVTVDREHKSILYYCYFLFTV